MRREEAAKLVAVCLAMWPNHPVPMLDALIDGWLMALGDLDYGDANAALTEYLQTGTFFPAPAELRTLVKAKQPALDSRLYTRYQRLRSAYQAGELTAEQGAELDRIEVRLGIAGVAPHRAMAIPA